MPELLTLPEHLSSPMVFSRVRVVRSLVLCVCFVDRCLSLNLPEHLRSHPVFSGVRVDRSLDFCVVFCRSVFVLFLLAIVLSVLRFTDSDYPFCIF